MTAYWQRTWLATISVGVWAMPLHAVDPQAQPGAIAGAWSLNKDQSDSPQSSDERGDSSQRSDSSGSSGRRNGGLGRGSGGFGRGAYGGDPRGSDDPVRRTREALHDIVNAPERMTITETTSMIIITTGDGRTTRLAPDGKKIKDESTNVERKTRWEGGKLISEISGLPNGKMTETYAVDAEHHRLSITLHIERSHTSDARDLHRVYDAAQ